MPEAARDQPTSARRRIYRLCRRASLIALSFVALYFLAVGVLGTMSANGDYRQAESGVEIRIWNNGVHTDFVLPTRTRHIDWKELAPLEHDASQWYLPYVLIGWGDHDFYLNTPTYDDISFLTVAKAVLLPTSTVLHLKYYSYLPEPSDTCVKLILTQAEYRELTTFIRESFELDDSGKPIRVDGNGYSSTDTFFRALGTYHLLYTCNNWANSGLKRIGVKTALWAPFSYAIFDHLKNR